MKEQLIDVCLIRDNSTLNALTTEVGSIGQLMVCCGCRDLEARIEGVLMIEQEEEAWPLCGECLRRLPLAGAIV